MDDAPNPSGATPIAIVGMAGVYPPDENLDQFFERIVAGRSAIPTGRSVSDANVPDTAKVARLTRRKVALEPFGIPPVQARAVPTVAALSLAAAERCFADAGLEDRCFPRERTDIVVGTCFASERIAASGLLLESVEVLDELRRALAGRADGPPSAAIEEGLSGLELAIERELGLGVNDKLYELASTMAAQIAVRFRLRGKSVAVESGELTAFVGLRLVVDALREGSCDLALLTCAQLFESAAAEAAIRGKRVLAEDPRPLLRADTGAALGEGVGAILFKRLDDALRDGDRVRGIVRGVGLGHHPQRTTFSYANTESVRRQAIEQAYSEAGYSPAAIQYLEAFGVGQSGETEQELRAFAAALQGVERPIRVGCVKSLIGNGFANAGMAAITKVVLALEHETFPGESPEEGDTIELEGMPFRIEPRSAPWRRGAGEPPRRASVSGAALGGSYAHVTLEAYEPDEGVTSRGARPRRAQPTSRSSLEPIAVVGFHGQFGRVQSASALWEDMLAGRDYLAPVSERVLPRRLYHSAEGWHPRKSYAEVGSPVCMSEADAATLGLLPLRARELDAAQLLGLHVAREALAATRGLPPSASVRAAVITGSNLTLGREKTANARGGLPWLRELVARSAVLGRLSAEQRRELLDRLFASRGSALGNSNYALDGLLASGISSLVSNTLGLPAVPLAVNAACASSLAGLDIACRALRLGSLDFVVVGGVELGVNLRDFVLCSRMRLLSPSRITPFDANADGFSLGEGAGFFVLRRLSDALAEGCRIEAVIRSIGGSTDAHSMIAPQADGQALAIRRAFEGVDFGPDAVDYVETHGTGTAMGDRVEIAALREVYAPRPEGRPLALGSVKSMLGHSMAAAGAAGLIKAILALRNKTILPNANLTTVHRGLELESIPAYLPTRALPWTAPPEGPRRAAVSSFGTGGVNYHLLVEESPQRS